MHLKNIAKNLELRENNIFFSKDNNEISYPDEGNLNCSQYEDDSYWFKHRNNVIINSVKKFSHSEPFFDIGGGNGFVSSGLQKEGVEVYLVEPGVVGANKAKQRGVKNVICSTLEDAQFKDSSLDSVGFFDVLEHIEDDNQFLKNITRFLKPGGFLYLTVPAYQFLWSEDDKYAGHYKRYTITELSKMLKQHNYQIKYATYIFSFLTFPILILRTIPTLLGLAKDPSLLKNQKNDHNKKSSIITRFMEKSFNWELKNVLKQKSIFTGSSCFIIAIKNK
jgi:SAM-dependent methyltransferase